MSMACADVSIMDYGAYINCTPGVITTLPPVRLTAKNAWSFQAATVSGSPIIQIQHQITNFDSIHAMDVPPQNGTWFNLIAYQNPMNTVTAITTIVAKYMRLVITAQSGSTGTCTIALYLRAAYGS